MLKMCSIQSSLLEQLGLFLVTNAKELGFNSEDSAEVLKRKTVSFLGNYLKGSNQNEKIIQNKLVYLFSKLNGEIIFKLVAWEKTKEPNILECKSKNNLDNNFYQIDIR